jgi:hypothetical protein
MFSRSGSLQPGVIGGGFDCRRFQAEQPAAFKAPPSENGGVACISAQKIKNESAVYMDAAAVARYLEHMKSKGTTERYAKNVGFYLAAWAEGFAGRDLRTVTLQDLLRELKKHKTARKNRITALKSFCAWLREVEGALTAGEDAPISLKIPVARPEKSVTDRPAPW